jgi:two-component system sensor histidine kinase VicK
MDPFGDQKSAAAAEHQAFVRHELRTPLAVIQPLVGMLLDGAAGPLDDKQLGYLRMLERNVGRLAAMITSLAETGWLEIAALPEAPTSVDVAGLVRDTVADVRASLEESPRVDVRCDDGLPRVHGDAHRLHLALRNVIVNACTFTPASGRVTVSAGLAEREGWIAVFVDDTGCGVPADEADSVFDFGFQGEAARNREGRGLGLGLAVARDIVEAHGGVISLRSDPGDGARVSIELPGATI